MGDRQLQPVRGADRPPSVATFEKSGREHVCVIWRALSNGNNPPVSLSEQESPVRSGFQGKIRRTFYRSGFWLW